MVLGIMEGLVECATVCVKSVVILILTEDNVSIAGRVLVDVRFVNDKEDVFALTNGNTGDTGHLFKAKFGHNFPGLFLTTALFGLGDHIFV